MFISLVQGDQLIQIKSVIGFLINFGIPMNILFLDTKEYVYTYPIVRSSSTMLTNQPLLNTCPFDVHS